VAAAAAAAAAGLPLPSCCCNATPAGWDWSLIARGVVSRTRVGYNEIATNDRVRSCPGAPGGEDPRLRRREEKPGEPPPSLEGPRCLKPPSIYNGAFRGVRMGKD